MGKVIITGFTAKSDGIVLETNIPAKLKTGNVKSKTCWVSWDKIGALLFENYTELEGVNLRNAIRNNSTLQEEVQKKNVIDEINQDKLSEFHKEYEDLCKHEGLGNYELWTEIGQLTLKYDLTKDDVLYVLNNFNCKFDINGFLKQTWSY